MFGIGPSRDGVVDQSGVGIGPFILEDFEPGIRGAGKRNPNYYKEGHPYFDSFEFLSVNDLPTLTTGLRTGEFDVIQPVDPKTAAKLDAEPGIRVVSVSGGSTITMPMHADKTPFDSVDFRLAMKYAVDRTELRDKIYRGHASLANDHPVPIFDQFYNADIPQRDYDPDKARFHLKKSGHEATKIQIHASGAVTGSIDAGVLYNELFHKYAHPPGLVLRILPHDTSISLSPPHVSDAVHEAPIVEVLPDLIECALFLFVNLPVGFDQFPKKLGNPVDHGRVVAVAVVIGELSQQSGKILYLELRHIFFHETDAQFDERGIVTPGLREVLIDSASFFAVDFSIGHGDFQRERRHQLEKCQGQDIDWGVDEYGYNLDRT